MGMLDTLGEVVVKGFSEAFSPASLVTGALSFLGGERRNQQQKEAAQAANTFSANQFATRYQTTMKDMQAAGLNPMLAYQQGASGQPSGQMAQYQDTISPAVASFQAQNLQESQQEANYGSASQARANVRLMNETVTKTKQEVENLKTTNDQIEAVIKNLGQQYNNLVDEGNNLKVTNAQIKATTSKLLKEIPLIDAQALRQHAEIALAAIEGDYKKSQTELNRYDIKAAESAGNFGRQFGQFRPVIELLVDILKPRGGGITINK